MKLLICILNNLLKPRSRVGFVYKSALISLASNRFIDAPPSLVFIKMQTGLWVWARKGSRLPPRPSPFSRPRIQILSSVPRNGRAALLVASPTNRLNVQRFVVITMVVFSRYATAVDAHCLVSNVRDNPERLGFSNSLHGSPDAVSPHAARSSDGYRSGRIRVRGMPVTRSNSSTRSAGTPNSAHLRIACGVSVLRPGARDWKCDASRA